MGETKRNERGRKPVLQICMIAKRRGDSSGGKEGRNVTTYSSPKGEPRPFRTAAEVRREPAAPRSDEQVRAQMRESVRRNAETLKTLSKL